MPKLENNGEGSAILVVIFVLMLVALFSSIVQRNAIMLVDTVLQRTRHEQIFRATEALLTCGILICQENSALILEQKGPQALMITSPTWPTGIKNRHYKAELTYTVHGKAVHIRAELCEEGQAVCCIHCSLKQQEEGDEFEGMFLIEDWRLDAC